MLRIAILVSFSCFIFFSCRETNPRAKKLCDCYRNLHVAKTTKEVNFWSDSCTNLYLDILQELSTDADEMNAFETDYKKCQ